MSNQHSLGTSLITMILHWRVEELTACKLTQVDNGAVASCLTNVSSSASCEDGYACAPLTTAQLSELDSSLQGILQDCVKWY